MRAIEHEVKFLSANIARRWFGPDGHAGSALPLDVCGAVTGQPVPPPPDRAIRVMYWAAGRGTSTTQLTFDGGLTRAWMDLSGPLDNVIDYQLPREMTRVAMAEHFGTPLTWWVDEGTVIMAMPDQAQSAADAHCRAVLTQGRAVRLSALFALRDPPNDTGAATVQAHSVVRFLLSQKPQPAAVEGNQTGRQSVGPRASPEGAFLTFVAQGKEPAWNKAAKTVYGFEDVAAMEAAWLQWMKSRGSQPATPPPAPIMPPPRAHPPLIPPVKLTEGP
jgi:hypothetical protein